MSQIWEINHLQESASAITDLLGGGGGRNNILGSPKIK
jgi:hypothetical protein